MKYLSVCSGIEAATTAWHHLGWKPVAFSEVEPFPSAVLAHHWPDTPNLGDMTKYESWNIDSIDLLVGGTPCQSFSVAGLRKGLRDPRGGLMLTYLEIAQRLRPRWVVWENVPGVLSSNGGRDFGAFLGALGDLGYGWAYRVLDAQWFGVAQRRRRVFVVGCLGDAASAAAVLFESESVRRDSPPSREKGQGVAGTPASRTSAGGGLGADFDLAGSHWDHPANPHPTLNQSHNIGGIAASNQELFSQRGGGLVPSWWDGSQVSQTLDAVLQKGKTMPEKNRFPAVLVPYLGPPWKRVSFAVDCVGGEDDDLGSTCSICGLDYAEDCQCPGPTQDDMDYCEFAGVLYAREHPPAVCVTGDRTHALTTRCAAEEDGTGRGVPLEPVAFAENFNAIKEVEIAPAMTTSGYSTTQNAGGLGIAYRVFVRRLTPVECERLQGFPDDHTLIPWRGKPADQCPDGPRYKAIGNSMAVPVMRWIGERIQQQQQKTP